MTDRPPAPCFPSRIAAPAIRGYWYQILVTALRWLDLGDDEVLVCEGDEDLDRWLLDEGQWRGEQIKALKGPVTPRTASVSDSVKWYARTFVARARQGIACQWLFTTTAALGHARDSELPHLENWHEPTSRGRIIDYVRGLDLHAAEQIEQIDGGWERFIESVTWRFNAPSVDVTRDLLKREVEERWPDLPADICAARMLTTILESSIQDGVSLRTLNRTTLDELHQTVANDLQAWADEHGLSDRLKARVQGEVRLALDQREIERRHQRLNQALQRRIGRLTFDPKPSELLRSEVAVVPFAGRETELSALDKWFDDRTGPILVWGPGGTGKTRLLIEWCNGLRQGGIPAGFFDRHTAPEDLFEADGRRVAAIDYAEARIDEVERLLSKSARNPDVRLVLLARAPGEWWSTLGQADFASRGLVQCAMVLPLRPWAPEPVLRLERFSAALDAFAAALQRDKPHDAHPPPSVDDPLLIQIAALLAVLGEEGPAEEDVLLDRVIEHESRYWWKAIADSQTDKALIRGASRVCRRLMGLIALTGDVSESALDGLVAATAPPDVRRTLLEIARSLYGSVAGVVGPVGPDLVAERLAQIVVGEWPEVVEVAERAGLGRHAWTVLARRVARVGHGAWIEPHLKPKDARQRLVVCEIAPSAGETFIDSVAHQLQAVADVEIATDWLSDLPERSFALAPVREAAMRVLLTKAVNDDDQVEVGRLAHNLAGHLAMYTHRFDEALTLADQAVEAHSVGATPTHGSLGLVLSTVVRANMLDRNGRAVEAIPSLEWAITIMRGWQSKPEMAEYVHGPHFINALKSLAVARSHGPLPSTALEPAREAMDLARRVDDPALLASVLVTLDIIFCLLDRHADAVPHALEAAEILDGLASSAPENFGLEFAQVLSNAIGTLTQAGQPGRALALSERALEHLRQLAGRWPKTAGHHLASTLSNRAILLMHGDRIQDARDNALESAIWLRRLAPAHRLQLASHLQNAARISNQAGHREEASRLMNEALTMLRAEASQREPTAMRLLASALLNGTEFTPPEDGIDLIEEAVMLLDELIHEVDSDLGGTLARALLNRSRIRDQLGQSTEAVADAVRAVALMKAAYARSPAAYADDLSSALSGLGMRLAGTGRQGEAVMASAEGAEIARIAVDQFEASPRVLARALVNLTARLLETGQHALAAEHCRRAVGLVEPIVGDIRDPEVSLTGAAARTLSTAYHNLSIAAASVDSLDEAIWAMGSALVIRGRRLDAYPAERRMFVASLDDLIGLCRRAGRVDEAEQLELMWKTARGNGGNGSSEGA